MWYSHMTEYYSATKRKGILTCAPTWLNSETVTCEV